ncbi:hypothetical protein BLOT_009894 [Blomia tropicalis]|nr:hypothetical protein BLOT_009894 [Blomia tropicalis]
MTKKKNKNIKIWNITKQPNKQTDKTELVKKKKKKKKKKEEEEKLDILYGYSHKSNIWIADETTMNMNQHDGKVRACNNIHLVRYGQLSERSDLKAKITQKQKNDLSTKKKIYEPIE